MWHTGSAAAPTWNQDPEWHSRRAKKARQITNVAHWVTIMAKKYVTWLKSLKTPTTMYKIPTQVFWTHYFGPTNGPFDKLFFPGIKLSTITRVEGVWVFFNNFGFENKLFKNAFSAFRSMAILQERTLSGPFKRALLQIQSQLSYPGRDVAQDSTEIQHPRWEWITQEIKIALHLGRRHTAHFKGMPCSI